MNRDSIDKIADAVLYEGYVLYPYRPAVKNRQRWTFGGLYPRAHCEARSNGDAWRMQTECLVRGDARSILHIRVRFLHLVSRLIGVFDPSGGDEATLRFVDSLQVGDQLYQAWQEATEREIVLDPWRLGAEPCSRDLAWEASRCQEPIRDAAQNVVGAIVREQAAIAANVHLSSAPVSDGLHKVCAAIENRTSRQDGALPASDAAMHSMASTHLILRVEGGECVSLIDPPAEARDFAGQCVNIGAWPVLVGDPGQRDTMLAAPIILYDYPQIAPASPGDLFDGTEIDEILSLHIRTLTDEERRQAAGLDERVRGLLARTDALDGAQLADLHGSMQPVAPISQKGGHMSEMTERRDNADLPSIRVGAIEFKPGDPVRLWPLGRADIFDMVLKGKTAVIESIERDFEDRVYVAVVVDDDPGQDLGLQRQPGHRFFFGVEEIELLQRGEKTR